MKIKHKINFKKQFKIKLISYLLITKLSGCTSNFQINMMNNGEDKSLKDLSESNENQVKKEIECLEIVPIKVEEQENLDLESKNDFKLVLKKEEEENNELVIREKIDDLSKEYGEYFENSKKTGELMFSAMKKGQEDAALIVKSSLSSLQKVIEKMGDIEDISQFDAGAIKEKILELATVQSSVILQQVEKFAATKLKEAELFDKTIEKLSSAAEKVLTTWEKGRDKIREQYEKKVEAEEKAFYKELEAIEKKREKDLANIEKKIEINDKKMQKELAQIDKKFKDEIERKNLQNKLEQEVEKANQLLLEQKNAIELQSQANKNREEEKLQKNIIEMRLKESEVLLTQEMNKAGSLIEIEKGKVEIEYNKNKDLREEFDKQMKIYEQEMELGRLFIENQIKKGQSYRFTNDPPKIVEENDKKIVKPGFVSWKAF
jgi:hypothetical protein